MTLVSELRRMVRHHMITTAPTEYRRVQVSDDDLRAAVILCTDEITEWGHAPDVERLLLSLALACPTLPVGLLENLARTVVASAPSLCELTDETPGAPGW